MIFVVFDHVCDLFVVMELVYALICVICMHIWCCDATDVGFAIYICYLYLNCRNY